MYFILLGIIFLAFFILTLPGKRGLLKSYKLFTEKRKIEARIGQIDKENLVLKEKIKRLSRDPEYIEKVAREELGLARPDEIIYIFKDKKKKR